MPAYLVVVPPHEGGATDEVITHAHGLVHPCTCAHGAVVAAVLHCQANPGTCQTCSTTLRRKFAVLHNAGAALCVLALQVMQKKSAWSDAALPARPLNAFFMHHNLEQCNRHDERPLAFTSILSE